MLPPRSLPRRGADEENTMPSTIAATAVAGVSIPNPTLGNDVGVGNAGELPTVNREQSDEDKGLRWAALLAASDSLQMSDDGLARPSCPMSTNEQ